MSLTVVRTNKTGNKACITIAAQDEDYPFDKLQSMEARNLAIAEAGRLGIPAASINSFAAAPYPVKDDYTPLADPAKDKLAGYCIDLDVLGKLF